MKYIKLPIIVSMLFQEQMKVFCAKIDNKIIKKIDSTNVSI